MGQKWETVNRRRRGKAVALELLSQRQDLLEPSSPSSQLNSWLKNVGPFNHLSYGWEYAVDHFHKCYSILSEDVRTGFPALNRSHH